MMKSLNIAVLKPQYLARRCLFSYLETVPPSAVPLTADKYPEVKRKAFKTVNHEDFSNFRYMLINDPTKLSTNQDTLLRHNCDWMRCLRGQSPLVLFPRTTEEVSSILKYCNEENIAIVPQGANTSMVGGSVPVHDEVILNTSKIDSIELVDPISGSIVCGPGCSLNHLSKVCLDKDLYFPIDHFIKEAHIGGIVSADTAGPRASRYGVLHTTVLGLEVVLPNGDVMNNISLLKKDNSGYNTKHLFIGSEGTLGVITKVSISCPIAPKSINSVIVSCSHYNQVIEIFMVAKHMLGEIVSACEFLDQDGLEAVNTAFPLSTWTMPIHPFTVLVETAGACQEHDKEKLTTFLEFLKEKNLVIDGAIGSGAEHAQKLWEIFKCVPVSLVQYGYVYRYDIGLPQEMLYCLVEKIKETFKSEVQKVVGSGHLLDGTLHIYVQAQQYSLNFEVNLEDFINQFVSSNNGVIASELGCGFKHRNQGKFSKDPVELKLMTQLKNIMDPKGIMNPYKMFPDNQ